MTENLSAEKARTPLWQKFALILGGTIFAFALVVAVLLAFPQLLGGDMLDRAEAGTTLQVEFRLTDGDYFFHQAGSIRPPDEDTLLAAYSLSWDENGFRIPQMQAEHYPIAALGDSFTEGTTVALPWTDVLATALNVPVRNYGYRGYGPREIAATAEQYMSEDERTWVLYAHFSGNDLANGNRAIRDDLMERDPLNRVEWLARQAQGTLQRAEIVTSPDGHYTYPMPVIIGAYYYDIALLEDLMWWQVAPEGGFLGTETFNIIGDALDTVSASANETACRAVIFIPSKEQLYYRYIHVDVRQWVRGIARQTVTNAEGIINLVERPMSEEEEPAFLEHLGDQRDAMRELAAQHGWLFIDLLQPFEEAAAAGQLLYYQYDGHWNQDGHNLAAQVIADFMRSQQADCPLTR